MISILEWAVEKKLFRNANHALWFQMSVWLLILTLAYYFYPNSSIIIFLPIAIHLVAFIQSSITYKRKEESQTLSQDCIWFNALMSLFYIIIYFVITNSF